MISLILESTLSSKTKPKNFEQRCDKFKANLDAVFFVPPGGTTTGLLSAHANIFELLKTNPNAIHLGELNVEKEISKAKKRKRYDEAEARVTKEQQVDFIIRWTITDTKKNNNLY
jgi:hypothetical protein